MAQVAVIERKCTGCAACVSACPFSAIQLAGNLPQIDAGCRLCGICVKQCPQKALILLEGKREMADLQSWQGALVLAEVAGGVLHPVTLELVGKARELMAPLGHPVRAVCMGHGLGDIPSRLTHYGVDEVFTYDDPALAFFRADSFAAAAADAIKATKPAIVLVGATAMGRSLAPRLATRFRTGLTADCTALKLNPDGGLVQIRPAFGGNIMAQIITPYTRPQFATVRYKVMEAPAYDNQAKGKVIPRSIPKEVTASLIRHIATEPVPQAASISDAEVLVVVGRGVTKQQDMALFQDLAHALGGMLAVTRPLVEKGWAPHAQQIGLSGRTVKPKLIITFGVSGAIQFTASMQESQTIVAVNNDPEAPIFEAAHIGIVADLYEVAQQLLAGAREGVKA